MRLTRLVSCALITAAATAAAAQQAATGQAQPAALQDLSGLWSAKKWFGPDVRGLLVIERGADGLRADVGGRYAPVTQRGSELAFELAGDQGRFTGELEKSGIVHGFWIR